MANLLWGKVFYKAHFAGYVREEPGFATSFTYDEAYLQAGLPAIAYTLPLQAAPHIHPLGLLPFFDNLVSEGWLEHAQTRLLGKRTISRFALLLAFGQDCAGAVSIVDPNPMELTDSLLDKTNIKEFAVLASRASLSGIQPKLMLVEKEGKFYPAKTQELSTHIAKFPSLHHADLVANEYLSMLAFTALVPDDEICAVHLGEVEGLSEQALLIKRFDREAGERVHFEEFNQLLNKSAEQKYEGAYFEMANFMRQQSQCLPAEIYRLYLRILAGLLLGNTDMHLKNFALLYTSGGLRLTPNYDQVCASLYGYKTLALKVAGVANIFIDKVKAKQLVKMGEEFLLSRDAIEMAVRSLEAHLEAAKQAIAEASLESAELKDQIITTLGKRWNGTFALIGKALSTKL